MSRGAKRRTTKETGRVRVRCARCAGFTVPLPRDPKQRPKTPLCEVCKLQLELF